VRKEKQFIGESGIGGKSDKEESENFACTTVKDNITTKRGGERRKITINFTEVIRCAVWVQRKKKVEGGSGKVSYTIKKEPGEENPFGQSGPPW